MIGLNDFELIHCFMLYSSRMMGTFANEIGVYFKSFRCPFLFFLSGHLYAESRDKAKLKLALDYLAKVTKADPNDYESIIDYAQVLEQNHPDKSVEQYFKDMILIFSAKFSVLNPLRNYSYYR